MKNFHLSPIEKEIAVLIAKGLKDQEIAAKLFISKRLVCKHIQFIKKKWNVSSRVSIGVIACYLGWYSPTKKIHSLLSVHKDEERVNRTYRNP